MLDQRINEDCGTCMGGSGSRWFVSVSITAGYSQHFPKDSEGLRLFMELPGVDSLPVLPLRRGHVCQLSVPIARSSWASLHLPRCASLPLGTSFGQVVPHLKISAENPALHSIPILDPQECPAGIG